MGEGPNTEVVPEVAVVLRQRTASFLLRGGPELRRVPFSHVIEASSLALGSNTMEI